ncbi:MAG: hypothetical protein Q7U44_05485 [Desulfuromonadales bacterium]|nr:hypothetical protein [Desulfuromonadales bacterium]
MKRTYALAVIMIATALSGCTLPRPESAANSQYLIEIVPTSPATIASAKVIQEGNAVVVSGKVRKPHEFHLPGKVLVVVCGQNAVPLVETHARISGYASKRGGAKEARFSARIEMAPPAKTTFRLRYEAPGLPDNALSCQ